MEQNDFLKNGDLINFFLNLSTSEESHLKNGIVRLTNEQQELIVKLYHLKTEGKHSGRRFGVGDTVEVVRLNTDYHIPLNDAIKLTLGKQGMVLKKGNAGQIEVEINEGMDVTSVHTYTACWLELIKTSPKEIREGDECLFNDLIIGDIFRVEEKVNGYDYEVGDLYEKINLESSLDYQCNCKYLYGKNNHSSIGVSFAFNTSIRIRLIKRAK